MAINNDLLIASPTFQDILVDKNGQPMANGTVTCYQDNSRTTLKNWYYQTGTPGSYNFLPLPNPLRLSAAGTICDINGVDTIPFFYPYSEVDRLLVQKYYIVIENYFETNQITRANFPYNLITAGGTPTGTSEETNNYIINNVFWRNIGTLTLSSSSAQISAIVAPSQHDGFQYPDITFNKNNNSATDIITFMQFAQSPTSILIKDITPEFYLNHHCTVAGTSETSKYYLFPISLHLLTLSITNPLLIFTVTIQAQTLTTNPGTFDLPVSLIQDPGYGTAFIPQLLGTMVLTSGWFKFQFQQILPSTLGIVTSAAGDDALYLQIALPTNTVCDFNFTKPSFYLTSLPPLNDFSTYDQIDAIINSPRTGDIRTSINSWYYWGWVPMNGGTIGNASSNAVTRANIDTWPLFNLIWTLFAQYSAPAGGTSDPVAQMYNSSGTPVGYGPNITVPTTAFSDWSANNQIALTQSMGQVFAGTVPISALLAATPTYTGYTSVVTASSSTGLLFTTASANLLNLFLGNTVTFTGPSLVNVASTAVYYVVPISTTTFKIAISFANALSGTVVAYTGVETGAVTANIQLTGSSEGEYAHTQLVAELAAHTHPPLTSNNFVTSSGTTGYMGGTGGLITNVTTGIRGNSQPFNVMQPTTFMNVYIKL